MLLLACCSFYREWRWFRRGSKALVVFPRMTVSLGAVVGGAWQRQQPRAVLRAEDIAGLYGKMRIS